MISLLNHCLESKAHTCIMHQNEYCRRKHEYTVKRSNYTLWSQWSLAPCHSHIFSQFILQNENLYMPDLYQYLSNSLLPFNKYHNIRWIYSKTQFVQLILPSIPNKLYIMSEHNLDWYRTLCCYGIQFTTAAVGMY